MYVGQPVGAILAETRELAHRAARLVTVEYEDLQPILTIEVQEVFITCTNSQSYSTGFR